MVGWGRQIRNEFSNKCDHFQQRFQLSEVLWRSQIEYSSNFVLCWPYACCWYHMSQKLCFSYSENWFGFIDLHVRFSKLESRPSSVLPWTNKSSMKTIKPSIRRNKVSIVFWNSSRADLIPNINLRNRCVPLHYKIRMSLWLDCLVLVQSDSMLIPNQFLIS